MGYKWLVLLWFALCDPTNQLPVLEDDTWHFDWPLELDVDVDDGGRSVKTTRPLVVLCQEDGLATRRPPGQHGDGEVPYILVKPSQSRRQSRLLSTPRPCLVTRHPPIYRSSTARVHNNIAIWPPLNVIFATPSSSTAGKESVDPAVFVSVAGQLVDDPNWQGQTTPMSSTKPYPWRTTNKPSVTTPVKKETIFGSILHTNLIFTTPPPPQVTETEVECGCDGEEHAHEAEYLPLPQEHKDPPPRSNTSSKPVTSNVLHISPVETSTEPFSIPALPVTVTPQSIRTDQPEEKTTHRPSKTTPETTTSTSTTDDQFTRQPEEPIWTGGNLGRRTTTPKIRVVTNVVTSISGEHVINDRRKTTTTTSTTTSRPPFKPFFTAHTKKPVEFTKIEPNPSTQSIDPIKKPTVPKPIISTINDNQQPSNIPSPSTTSSNVQKTMKWLFFISKHALLLLLVLLFLATKKNDNQPTMTTTQTPFYPPLGNLPYGFNKLMDTDYSNMAKVYENVLSSLATDHKTNYQLPSDYASNQVSDVWYANNQQLYGGSAGQSPGTGTGSSGSSGKDVNLQLDYILNVLNSYSSDTSSAQDNYQHSNAIQGYG